MPEVWYDCAVKKRALLSKKKNLSRFEVWEKDQSGFKNPKESLRLIGEWVDFFLSRHPRRRQIPDVRGIQIMLRRLSVLS
jgi:hypothetical protein